MTEQNYNINSSGDNVPRYHIIFVLLVRLMDFIQNLKSQFLGDDFTGLTFLHFSPKCSASLRTKPQPPFFTPPSLWFHISYEPIPDKKM